ncbi:MAG: CHC2 zinc finger domain-containing protein, partial [Bacteroides sp.]|nr:CHC2 zinc finger domain-containing protein [Bacteroides sp.]
MKWRGSRGTGLCPFHDDKHPSLTVDTRKQRFICYACVAKGDVIEFIKRIEGCDFKEALEKLEGGRLRPMATSPERVLSRPAPAPIVISDHNRFLKLLMPYVPPCRELIPVYHRFEVGLSPHRIPDGWQAQGNRIVFPIRDEDGVLRGFSARSREEEVKTAKYIHTGSSQRFRSSEHLYGLHFAKKSILETGLVYITEWFKMYWR